MPQVPIIDMYNSHSIGNLSVQAKNVREYMMVQENLRLYNKLNVSRARYSRHTYVLQPAHMYDSLHT